eukprot:c2256_g1_i1 orf=188-1858(+)
MHRVSKRQILPEKFRCWNNQDKFLEDQDGHKESMAPRIILAGSRFGDDGFELLSWVVNVAARPGDSVVALQIGNDVGKLECNTELLYMKFSPLKDLCNAKQVQLDVRFNTEVSEETALIRQAWTLGATMVAITAFGNHVRRCSRRRGSFLVRYVPPGCTVVIVRNYKVLFYRENMLNTASEHTWLLSGGDVLESTSKLIPKCIEQTLVSLRQHIFHISALQKRKTEVGCDFENNRLTDCKPWTDQAGDYSPRGVLEGPHMSSESDGSSPSSSYSSLSNSFSKKALLFCASFYDGAAVCETQPHNCLGLRKNISIQHFPTFPPTSRLRRLSASFHSSSMRHSFKSYFGALWGTQALDQGFIGSLSAQSNEKQCWRCFSYEELVLATINFHSDNVVGKGGNAEVYKGSLPDGQLVAIKRLTRSDMEEKETAFLSELGIISHVSHPNTTPLVGFCVERGLYLVFSFSPHGSLASFLSDPNAQVLEWSMRFKVAVGTARGLHYLHTGCQHRIIHRDVKASNILLGLDFEPQISDFGLAKWLPEEWTHHVVTPIEGTFGYL